MREKLAMDRLMASRMFCLSFLLSPNPDRSEKAGALNSLFAICSVPRQKTHVDLLEVDEAPLDRRQAVPAQMRPLMVVIPQGLLQDPPAGLGDAGPMNREALLVDHSEEPFDLAVRLRTVRSQPSEKRVGDERYRSVSRRRSPEWVSGKVLSSGT